MADPYQSCPCGSGKSFKWCCQPFFAQVEKARSLHQQGQHEAALRTMAQLVEQHPRNASILGYQAELLYMNQRLQEADEAIQKAFALNPDFPFGHGLRAMIRKDEGEIIGALIELRKAAELYDLKANDVLAEIYASIFDIEMRLNRPVAARAALERCAYHNPGKEIREALESVFGPESRLPASARKTYRFRPADAAHAEIWKTTLPAKEHSRLSEAAAAFEKLTNRDANDAAAWFNLGLVQAWLGEHLQAIEALRKSVELEGDPERLAEAGALIEVLRCGAGMMQHSDYLEHRIMFQLQRPELAVKLLEEWHRKHRLSGARSDEENGTFTTLVLEETSRFGMGAGPPAAKLAAYLFIVGNVVRLWGPIKDSIDKVAAEMTQKLAGAMSPPAYELGFCNFSDVAVEAMLIPTRETEVEAVLAKFQEHAQQFFEEVWIHRPLKALASASPIEAASHPGYQKRLPGLLRFMQECYVCAAPRVAQGATLQTIVPYDFDRLRHKLGLTTTTTLADAKRSFNIDVLTAAELGELDSSQFNEEQLEQAFRAAMRLETPELAGKFARDLVGRPPSGAHPDRFPYFHHLIQLAQAGNDVPAIMTLLDEAEKADAETNRGQRGGDYALRRGQLLAKNDETDKAYEVFRGLLETHSNELKYYGPAAETMLSKKKGEWALQFAEQGLAKARSQNNRDSEQYLMELVEAAKRA